MPVHHAPPLLRPRAEIMVRLPLIHILRLQKQVLAVFVRGAETQGGVLADVRPADVQAAEQREAVEGVGHESELLGCVSGVLERGREEGLTRATL